jgi:predicted metal-binding membrane protein
MRDERANPGGDGAAPRGTALTSPQAAATAITLAAAVGTAAAGWVISVREMNGMDMGVATGLGSLAFFIALWVGMMAAMMLPGAAPVLVRCARGTRPVLAVPRLAGAYLGVWTLAGLAVYALYRPHGPVAAGAITIAAGIYELTPLKRRCRRHCRERARTGSELGRYCAGSSIGLMLVFVAVGVMSITWMAVITVLVTLQKLLPPKAAIDMPLALAIIGLGIVILAAPSWIPGLAGGM